MTEFRRITKEPITGLVPTEVADVVRTVSARERASISATLTRALCDGLGLDASKYGLDGKPDRPHRRRKTGKV